MIGLRYVLAGVRYRRAETLAAAIAIGLTVALRFGVKLHD